MADFLQFFDQGLHALAAAWREFVDALAPHFLRPVQASPSEHPRVLNHGGATNRKSVSQFTGTTRFMRKATEQFSAGGIAERGNRTIY